MARRLTIDEIKKYVSENSGCTLISTGYKNSHTNIMFTCELCSTMFETSFDSFKHQNKHVCDKCGREIADERRKNNHEDIANYISETGCELLSKYKGTQFPMKIRCGSCGKIFYCSLDSYRYKKYKRCEKCNRKISEGELILEELLKINNIKYIHQYGFDDCRRKYKLNFDFYLVDYNILWEVDGRQHHMVIEHWGGKEGFEEIQERDNIKNDYCEENNILLIRTDYDGIHKEDFTIDCENTINSIIKLN